MGNVDGAGYGPAHADEQGVPTWHYSFYRKRGNEEAPITGHSTAFCKSELRARPETSQGRRIQENIQREKREDAQQVEYEVGLHDDDDTKHNRRFVRASSVVSPSKAPLIFPMRCKSVPLDGEDVVPSVDLATVPPSPRRSPNRGDIEVKRAPSLPLVASDHMEVDAGELHADDLSQFGLAASNQHKFPAFNYTVNFATPIANKRALFPLMTPLSPLTPLPPTPFTARPPKACGVPQVSCINNVSQVF
ncbi:hypothetical protein F5141DRAFT_645560 [Pisolithus sp. B1]|nr:hypothetical protein F5141DRAFT_645560 [Pisolithus sp. B1]